MAGLSQPRAAFLKPTICNRIIRIVLDKITCRGPSCTGLGWLFLFLGVAVSVVALHPRWRSRWGWGRTGQAGPLSAFAWLAWIFAFLAISATGFQFVAAHWVIVGFLLMVAAGIFDSVRNSKRR